MAAQIREGPKGYETFLLKYSWTYRPLSYTKYEYLWPYLSQTYFKTWNSHVYTKIMKSDLPMSLHNQLKGF